MNTRAWVVGLMIAGASIAAAQTIVSVDPAARYQKIEGFGGSLAFNENFFNVQQSAFDELTRRIYDDLRINVIRIRMRNEVEPQNDNDDPATISWQNVRPLPDTTIVRLVRAGRAPGRDVKVLLTPWSPPAWMKTNNNVNNGGTLRPNMEPELAELFRMYLTIWRDQLGIPVSYVGVQNEPGFTAQWESCIYSPDAYNRAVRAIMPRLRNWGFDSLKLVGPDGENIGMSLDYADSLLGPGDIRDMLSGFSVHNYSTAYQNPEGATSGFRTIAQRCATAAIPTWMTEYGNIYNENPNTLAEANIEAQHWLVALNELNASTYLVWQLADCKFSNQPIHGLALFILNRDNLTFSVPKKYHFVKQFTHFIDPGMLRVRVNGLPSRVAGAAFTNATGSKGVAVLQNVNSTPQTIRFAWPGIDTLFVWRSSRSEDCAQLLPIVRSGGQFEVVLTDSSVTTLVGYINGTLPSGSFSVSQDTLPVGGGNTTLQWTSTNAQSASIDGGIGTVQLSGSRSVNVRSTSVFTLTLTNTTGSRAYSVRVHVRAPSGSPQDITASGTPIALVTSPAGGGNHSIEVIRDGVTPAVGSNNPQDQYDTYTGTGSRDFDWIGYEFSNSRSFSSLFFQEGIHFGNGGWFNNLRVQVRVAGQWVDAQNLQSTPAYAGGNTTNCEMFTLSFVPIAGEAIRIAGTPGDNNFVSVAELRVFASNLTDVNPSGRTTHFALNQNYPNPFNPATTIEFSVPTASHVRLSIFNMLGQEIRILVDEELNAGPQKKIWDGKDNEGGLAPTGIYLCKMSAGDFLGTRKMILLK